MIQFPRPYRKKTPPTVAPVGATSEDPPENGNQVASLYTMSCVFVRMHQPKGLKNTKKMGDDSITERCEYDKWAKNPYVTFQYTAWFIGILMLAYYNLSIPGLEINAFKSLHYQVCWRGSCPWTKSKSISQLFLHMFEPFQVVAVVTMNRKAKFLQGLHLPTCLTCGYCEEVKSVGSMLQI